jgi:hypothetical protein
MPSVLITSLQALLFFFATNLGCNLLVYSWTVKCDDNDDSCRDRIWWISLLGSFSTLLTIVFIFFAFLAKS